MNAPLTGLYVHVPFCARTCDYCAFYQAAPSADAIRRYLAGIEAETRMLEWPRKIETVFWGGGTPGLLASRDILHLGKVLQPHLGGSPAEWSVEMTPLSVTDSRLEVLRQIGVTRVSLGIQSFQERLLDALGRQHTPEQAYRAYERLRQAGFDNVNFDLMFALPGQSDADWEQDVNEAIRLGPEHISTYCLTFEEDTKLWLKLSKGAIRRDIEAEARLYRWTWDRLARAGYAQYEISNFAKPGHECLHNLNTWRMEEWIGLGPSAASQYRRRRGTNVADLDQWLVLLAKGERATEDVVNLTPEALAEDALIFGLRMNAGVDLDAWKQRSPHGAWTSVEDCLRRLETEGVLLRTGSRIHLSERGRLLADSVGSELLGLLA